MKIEKYGASWCGPCKALDKTLDEFCKRHPDIDVVRFDVDELDEDTLYNLKIKTVPILRFIQDDGTEIKRFIGAQPLMIIENELSQENA